MTPTQARQTLEAHADQAPLTPPDVNGCERCGSMLAHKVADVCDGGKGDRLVDAFHCEECGAQGHVTRTLRGEETARMGPAFQPPAGDRVQGGDGA